MGNDILDFHFQTLLVEDSRDWIDDMRQAWGKDLDVASTADAARERLGARRYHFITLDQNLPGRLEGRVEPEVGVQLCRQVVDAHPCSPRVVFTGYGELHRANEVGRMEGTEYWEKSGTGKDDEDRLIYSAKGWAVAVRAYLQGRYLPFVLGQAGRFLPANLADQAQDMEKRYAQAEEDGRFFGRTIDLWQSTLHLAWAQAQAILAHAQLGGVRMTKPTDTLVDLERALKEVWRAVAGAGWFGPWGAYVGKGSAETGEGAGKRFLDGASVPLRTLRNQHAHGFTREVWTGQWENLRGPLLFLLDAAVLWADHPLLTGLRPVPGGTDRWQGEVIRGGGPWPSRDLAARSRSAPYPTHVYTRWQDPDGNAELVDLWPFVALEPDPKINRKVLWVTSHCDQGGRWWRRSLHDGQVERWPERDREGLNALERHFPSSRPTPPRRG